MILINWNCRGLGNPKAIRDVRLLVKEKQPNILFLRTKMGFYGVFLVDSVGRSGGLALFWDKESELSISNFSRRH
jgi:hypothetical protein